MANRRPQSGRRMDFGRNDRAKNFGRSGLNPWQTTGPTTGLPNLLPLSAGPTEATLALASNLINLLQPRQNPVPSLLDMPIRRDFGPDMARFDRGGYGSNRMGNQGNFRRSGNYVRPSDRMNRKPYRPSDRQNNKGSQKKDADSKAKPKESEQEKKDTTNEEKNEGESTEKAENKEEDEQPKTRYDNISSAFLKCHVCNKSMWDGRSFENHLSGRAHAIMMQKTAESYALTSDTMRQEFKIREMKRTRKIGSHPPRDFYCAMCDMYAADGAVHRTTVGHRKLKKYLHPTCTCCHKEMPTRIELDEHRLSAEHLRTIQEKQEVVIKPKPEVMVISNLTVEQSYLREGSQPHRRFKSQGDKDATENGIKEETEQSEEGKEEAGDTGESEQKTMEVDTDMEGTILDYKEGDDLSEATVDMIPAYSTERGVGASFLAEFKCFQCKLCRKLLDTQETADVHLRTWRHHQLFARLLTDKMPSAKRDDSAQEASGEAVKRPSETPEDGNWKRRRTEDADNEDSVQPDIKAVENEEEKEDEPMTEQEAAVDDSLEDWDRTIDEIIEDEKNNDNEEKGEEEADDEVVVVKKEVESPPSTPKTQSTPTTQSTPSARGRATPRGRGRGRPRRY